MHSKSHTILVQGQRVAVSEAVYRAYYQEREHARYLDRCAAAHESSLEGLQDVGVQVDHLAGAIDQTTTTLLQNFENSRLAEAFATLTPDEQEHLWALVLGETTERALAEQLGVSPATIHKRKKKALAKLAQLLSADAD